MRIVTSLTALLMVLAAAAPAHAQLQAPGSTPESRGPKLGQFEIKAYQVIPKTKTAVQLTSDTRTGAQPPARGDDPPSPPRQRGRLLRRQRHAHGRELLRLLVGSSGARHTVGGNPNYDGPGANPRPELPSIKLEQRNGAAPTSGARRCASCSRSTRWTAARCCGRRRAPAATHAGTAETAGIAMIDTIFSAADKNRIADAGCPL